MTTVALSTAGFPRFVSRVTASWCPIYLEPIPGSQERFVIAVAVVSDTGFHVELANSLDRLECLYGQNAVIVRHAATITAENLKRDLKSRSLDALTDFDPPVTGAHVGRIRAGEGVSLAAIGKAWMSSISSLYDASLTQTPLEMNAGGEGAGAGEHAIAVIDRLPLLVYDYVVGQSRGVSEYFRPDLRGHPRQRRSYEVTIDYASSTLAANFGTLQAGKLAPSVRLIKNRLWDLAADRNRDAMFNRKYELLVQVPSKNDPQFSSAQLHNVDEARRELEQQADENELRFETYYSIEEIGERVLTIQAS